MTRNKQDKQAKLLAIFLLAFALDFAAPVDVWASASDLQSVQLPTNESPSSRRADVPRRWRRGRRRQLLVRLVKAPYRGVKATGKFIDRGARRLVRGRRRPERRY